MKRNSLSRGPSVAAAILTLLLTTLPAGAATAAPSPLFGVSERLAPVARTLIATNSGTTLWLCQHQRQGRVLGLPVWRTATGYALAERGCDAPRAVVLDLAELAAAQRAGLIPAEVPEIPRLSLWQGIAGHWGWAVLTALAMAGVWLRRQRRARWRDRLARL
ncbi:hypothetical protein E0K89_004420 [Aquicoccus sp. SCR17]|nr:hypothetical protein [Carideicomes alvinocaridis]